ncbi:conserved virulence factor C family protein [Paenibacillus sp. BC26]|uniref:conserved virulence factor C family protein n=1 Tax=Paenibacillus sp. BC26 TaxID=1881032 RepID=UPI0008F1D344|nr:virulence factor [Paenibacillus sp. BC26]SFT03411.1 Scaffold protein Nfu/NifU N terminal [Paenibacillus sp. BC26]
MKLLGIEPTPSPNTMKLNVNEKLPAGQRFSLALSDADGAVEPLRSLLRIEGVRGLFRTTDFIALDRKPGADWERILAEARRILQSGDEAGSAEGSGEGTGAAGPGAESFGEAHAFVQLYRGIPMQVRVRTPGGEARAALPAQFTEAVTRAAASSMIRERVLEELGVRYGEPDEIAAELVRELEAAYPQERLEELIAAAIALGAAQGDSPAAPAARPAPLTAEQLAERLASPEWSVRYEALSRTAPEPAMLPLLAKAITDDNVSIRRLAVVYLGELRLPEAMPLLIAALRDASASVRRTAGDTLSDLGDPAAIPAMIEALRDRNKLVRWRAARFLYEVGDDSAAEALQAAAADPEFEVSLQARIALERIERGEEAAGSVWQQMTAQRNNKPSSD